MVQTRNKGKGRAPMLGSVDPSPTEHDPLLPSSIHAEARDRKARSTSRRVGSICLTASVAVLSLLLGAALLLALLGGSFKPSEAEIATLQKTAFRYDTTPVSLSVLNVTDDGVLVNATILCGIDLDALLGLRTFDSEAERNAAAERGERGTGAEWWERLRRWAASEGLGGVRDRTVIVNIHGAINIGESRASGVVAASPLFAVRMRQPMRIPMVSGVRGLDDKEWLQPVPVIMLAKPVASTSDLMSFGQRAWADGSMSFVVGVENVAVRLPGLTGWLERFGHIVKEDLAMAVQVPIPHLAGLPEPGHPINFAKLVKLEAYHLANVGDALTISAGASMPNLAKQSGINTTIPYGLPFRVVIPNADGSGEKTMAEVVTEPVILDPEAKDIKLRMSGQMVSDSRAGGNTTEEDDDESPLGPFIHNFLTGQDNAIIVRGLSSYPPFALNTTVAPPTWAMSSLSSIAINLVIPGPRPPPKVIHAMNLEHMRISRSGGKTRASGTVVVEIDLPGDIGNIAVDVHKVLPEVYMFDGPVTQPQEGGEYPANAFGHIRPDEYLNSTTEKGVDPEFPNRLTVRAPLEDVPVEILPNRTRVLAGFARKVIFSGGTMAGVNGSASAKMIMKGAGRLVLADLPIVGETWVGRQRLQEKSRMPDDAWADDY